MRIKMMWKVDLDLNESNFLDSRWCAKHTQVKQLKFGLFFFFIFANLTHMVLCVTGFGEAV